MPRRRPPQEFINDITVLDDGIRPVREIPEWTRNKLAILWAYLSGYAEACKNYPPFFFVDAMAGPGLCQVRATDEFLLGSTLIALKTEPPFTRCLSLEYSSDSTSALLARTTSHGERAIVRQGDCNRDLLSFMSEYIPQNRPLFILFDPEGAELQWTTVEEAARFRQGQRKSELLILLATSFLDRMLPNQAEIELHNLVRLNQVFPTPQWQQSWERKRSGEITPEQERQENAELYVRWLRDSVGYNFAASRKVTRPGSNASVYHLIFASDHDAGERIMTHVFDTMYPNEPNLKFPGF